MYCNFTVEYPTNCGMSPLPYLCVLLLELHSARFWQLCHHSAKLLNPVAWCNILELVVSYVHPLQPVKFSFKATLLFFFDLSKAELYI